jgi:phosphopantetheinyl transferase (holo-ACP synthase)
VEVVDDVNGAPRLVLRGAVAQAAADRGVTATSVSLTHEDPLASAIVILEGER